MGLPSPRFAAAFLALLLIAGPALNSQVRPVYSLGGAGLLQALERAQTIASALHVGAHPDDEDSQFIARVAWGDNARVAYLSLTRGEGGQNIIGTELFDALGVIRTEELLQARALDGGEQFFTRAIDYGFSKARAEAAAKWDQQIVLSDMVRVIRRFRPLVIYSRFSGTGADGHGQHQLAGHLTPLALEAAADPAQFPEQLREGLRPWRARKLYRGAGFRPDPAAPPTLELQTGVFDPMLGRYYTEIANEGRSQHKSQEMGTIESKGPRTSGLIRLDTPAAERSLFEGLDTSLGGIAAIAGITDAAFLGPLRELQMALDRTVSSVKPQKPDDSLASIADVLERTRALRERLKSLHAAEAARSEADFLLAAKENDLADALLRAAGVVVDPLSDAETLAPGGSLTVTVRAFFDNPRVAVLETVLHAPAGWKVEDAAPPAHDASDFFARFSRETPAYAATYRMTAPRDAVVTQPYYLDDPRDGDRYRWDAADPLTMPFAPPLLEAVVRFTIAGTMLEASAPIMYRFADRVRGELRRHINVVPPLSVGLDSTLLVVPAGSTTDVQRLVVRVANHGGAPASGTVRLDLPLGWRAKPATAPVALHARGDRASASFLVTAPPERRPGTHEILASAEIGGVTYSTDLREIAYPHIHTHRTYAPARTTVQVIDLETAEVNVGYVMGSGDQMPEMIRRMGIPVTLFEDATLATGDLARFDTIVVGIRASEARPAFVANHARLIDYVREGGTLIVQYQQSDYAARKLPPYPAEMSSRVTDEHAPVKIVAPDHPVFTFPNRIGGADFEGWVQERNLYAFTTFDPRYVPLLETADPGEPPQRGGQLYARVGKGHYVYTSYAWFRQLPAGVPGAYRMFANLLALPKAPPR